MVTIIGVTYLTVVFNIICIYCRAKAAICSIFHANFSFSMIKLTFCLLYQHQEAKFNKQKNQKNIS